MPYSSNLGTNLIVTGTQAGTWGDTTNFNLGTLMEQAISSYCTQQFSGTDITLPLSPGADAGGNTNPGTIYTAGTTSVPVSARNMYIECQGTSSGNNLIVPTNRKLYFVYNNTTGAITVKTLAGVGVIVPVGAKYALACNGTDIVKATTTDLTSVSGVLPTTNGGTGASTLAGANIPVTNAANIFTSKQSFFGTGAHDFSATLANASEAVSLYNVVGVGPSVEFYLAGAAVVYYTLPAVANWTINFRMDSTNALNAVMNNGESVTCALMATQGTTPYFNNQVKIDGTVVTPKWQGGVAPYVGNPSGIDVYSYTIVKVSSGNFTVLASQTQFK